MEIRENITDLQCYLILISKNAGIDWKYKQVWKGHKLFTVLQAGGFQSHAEKLTAANRNCRYA